MLRVIGLLVAAAGTLVLGLWVAVTWHERELARRTLLFAPQYADVELAYEPAWASMLTVLPMLARYPKAYAARAVLALYPLLTARSPTAYITDGALREGDRPACRHGRRPTLGDSKGRPQDDD